MCGESNVKCEIKVTELKDGYEVRVTGDKVKDVLKPEGLKKCIQSCCSGQGSACCS
ncbi:MAG: hypothetical protein ACOY3D_03410 [Candidatus Omnitrophota bacterium]